MIDPAVKLEGFIWKHLRHHMEHPICGFHRELIRLTQLPKVAIAAPTGFAKSYYFSFFSTLYELLENPGIQVLLVSAVGALAEHWVAKIRAELESNPSILAYYGPQNTKGKWAVDELHLDNGSILMAKGAEKAIRGFRPDMIKCDDMETDEMVLSPDRRKKFDDWFFSALITRLRPHGRLQVIGTILHPESFLAELMDKPRPGWVTRLFQATTPEGQPIWPDEWPLTKLAQRRREMGDYLYNQEYMNDPLPDSARIFQKDWIKYYEQLPEGLVYFTTIDPAISLKDNADYTAIVTCGVDADRNIYVVDIINRHMLPDETVDQIFNVYQRYHPQVVAVETVGFQRMLKFDLKEERLKRNLYPVITDLKSGGRAKVLRIRGLQPFFQSGKIYMKASQEELLTQLLRFPSTRCKDDIIDALAYQLDIIRPASEAAQQVNPESVYARFLDRRRQNQHSGQYYGNGE